MTKNSVHRVAIAGEFTIFTAAAVRAQMLEALDSGHDIEIDLAQVTEIDSAGVQLMVAAKLGAAVLQKNLSFSGHSPAVLDTLDLCDLSAYFGDPLLIHSRA